MDWLKQNSAAIQALASLASLVVTIVLVLLTAWYVRVTKGIASASFEQVRHVRDAARTLALNAAHGLIALSTRIRVPLEGLRRRGLGHRNLLEYSLLSEEDVVQLEALARQLSGDAARLAGIAAVSLRKISALISRAKSISEGTGWIPSPQERLDWDEAIDAGPRMLAALEEECRKTAA